MADRYRYPRRYRLTRRRDYLAVYRRGRRVRSASLTLLGRPNTGDGCRLGITVSRKIGNAVRRNRIKRMLREVYRLHRHQLSPKADLVINAHRSIHARSFHELEREFLSSFRRLIRNWER